MLARMEDTKDLESVRARLLTLWPDIRGLSVLCVGQEARTYIDSGFVATPNPTPDKGRICAAAPGALPFAAVSFERVLATPVWDLQEIWRVLRPGGRVMLIAPAGLFTPHDLRAAMAAERLAPLRIVYTGGWPLFPRFWLAEGEKRIFGRPPPRRLRSVWSWDWMPGVWRPQTSSPSS